MRLWRTFWLFLYLRHYTFFWGLRQGGNGLLTLIPGWDLGEKHRAILGEANDFNKL
jgi:hypothetical protein